MLIVSTKKYLDDSMIIFKKVFESFGYCVDGFKYRGPLIIIDGTHLYGRYEEKFMIIVVFRCK